MPARVTTGPAMRAAPVRRRWVGERRVGFMRRSLPSRRPAFVGRADDLRCRGSGRGVLLEEDYRRQGGVPSAAASGNVSSARSTVWSHSKVRPLQWLRSTPAPRHADQAALVLDRAVGVDRVLGHDRAEAELDEADRGLGHADVGLEADEHGGLPLGDADRLDRLRAGGQAEGRLLDRRRPVREAGEDPRVGVAVALRPFLDDDDRDVEQRGEPGHPRDAGDGVGRRRASVLAQRVIREEPGLRVDDHEDAVLAADERH